MGKTNNLFTEKSNHDDSPIFQKRPLAKRLKQYLSHVLFKLYIFHLLLFVINGLYSQNLVLNPSFENVNTSFLLCSFYSNQADFDNAINDWTMPTTGTTDIYHTSLSYSCSMYPIASTNIDIFGAQTPRTGDAMTGCMMYAPEAYRTCGGGTGSYREYIQGSLLNPLIPGKTYKIEFYVSLGDFCTVGISGIGIKFNSVPISVLNCFVYPAVPDAYVTTKITDKDNWTKIEFCYTPTDPYLQYFIIGNFNNNASTGIENLAGTINQTAYYYIDDVSIVPTPTTALIAEASYTNSCSSSTLSLTALPSAMNYTWTAPSGASITSGINSQYATAQGNGVYTVTVKDTSLCWTSSSSATVLVNTNSFSPSVASGTLSCTKNTVSLSVMPSSGATYTWSGPGIVSDVNTSSVTVNASGIYTVAVVDAATGCLATTTATVFQNATLPTVTITPASYTLACNVSTVQLSAASSSSNTVSYSWVSPAFGALNNASIVNPVASGLGVFTVTVNEVSTGCKASATATVVADVGVISVNSATVCSGHSVTLTVVGAADSYSWSPSGSLNASVGASVVASPSVSTSYTVVGLSSTCSATAHAMVVVIPSPTVSVSPGSSSICIGSAGATFTANGALTYSWLPSIGLSVLSGSVVTASPTVQMVYTVTGNKNGCRSEASFTVVPFSIALQVSPLSSSICSGGAATITLAGANSYASSLSVLSGSMMVAAPSATSVYTVTGFSGVCVASQVFTVNVTPSPTISIRSSSTSICAGGTSFLEVSGANSYSWVPSGATFSTIVVNPTVTTQYVATGFNEAGTIRCASSQSVLVSVLPKVNGTVSPSVEVCEKEAVMLSASGGSTVKWVPATGVENTEAASTRAYPLVSTTYTAIISNNGWCPDVKTVNVVVNPLPWANAGRDTSVVLGEGLVLMGMGNGTLTWMSGEALSCYLCQNAYVVPLRSACFTLEATTDKRCKYTDEVCVAVNREYAFYIPNSFTPNEDGKNDVFYVAGFGIDALEMWIFNRWGELIFRTNELNKGWDGKHKGVWCENGVYTYKVNIKTSSNKTEIKVGHVTLLGE